MPVPKFKTSKSKSRSRRASNFKATAPNLAVCPQCGKPKQPHCVCRNCGYYKGRPVVEYEVRTKPTQMG